MNYSFHVVLLASSSLPFVGMMLHKEINSRFHTIARNSCPGTDSKEWDDHMGGCESNYWFLSRLGNIVTHAISVVLIFCITKTYLRFKRNYRRSIIDLCSALMAALYGVHPSRIPTILDPSVMPNLSTLLIILGIAIHTSAINVPTWLLNESSTLLHRCLVSAYLILIGTMCSTSPFLISTPIMAVLLLQLEHLFPVTSLPITRCYCASALTVLLVASGAAFALLRLSPGSETASWIEAQLGTVSHMRYLTVTQDVFRVFNSVYRIMVYQLWPDAR